MNKELSPRGRIVLIGSVTLNIFLLAFVLGRMSMGPPPPPPPPHGGPGFFGMHEGPPPHGPHPGDHGDMPPPPFFSPSGLFSPEEMKADAAKNKENFDKMHDMRKAFGAQLQQGPVTRDQVLAHFAEIDQIMDTLRHSTQDRVADKITSMSVEERARFGEKLVQEPDHHFSDHGRAPGEPPPPPPGAEPGAPPADGEEAPPPPPGEH
jgi:hypothetical protein